MPQFTGVLPTQLVTASSANALIGVLNNMAANLLNSSATMNASSALLYANQMLAASSAFSTIVQTGAAGYQISS